MTRALICGSNGQDGSYLAEILLSRGADVVGIARQPTSRYVDRPRFRHVALDLGQRPALSRLLAEVQPDAIYHVAAIHGAAGFRYEESWAEALAVNVGSVHECLEFIRARSPRTALFYASSLKAFGASPPPVISEATPRTSSCLYSITKNAAAELIEYYRRQHGVRAWCGYLFNHDSPRRPASYFLPRLISQLATALSGGTGDEALATLNFACDWSSSAELMAMVVDLTARSNTADHVMASGVTWTGHGLAAALSAAAGKDWRDWLKVRETTNGRGVRMYHADIGRLERSLGRRPASDGLDVALWILAERHGVRLARPADAVVA